MNKPWKIKEANPQIRTTELTMVKKRRQVWCGYLLLGGPTWTVSMRGVLSLAIFSWGVELRMGI
jgi:hypothetical protein